MMEAFGFRLPRDITLVEKGSVGTEIGIVDLNVAANDFAISAPHIDLAFPIFAAPTGAQFFLAISEFVELFGSGIQINDPPIP